MWLAHPSDAALARVASVINMIAGMVRTLIFKEKIRITYAENYARWPADP